jgi:putative ATP-dependent endonuclease of OLD family
VLYDLAKAGSNWQVMATTHSPVFIDLSRDNTCVVRVERMASGQVTSTTVFRPSRAKLSNDEKENLKLLNLCDPYVAEFLFGGKTVIVEGDTEYSAFNYIASLNPDKYRNTHIIRARGKVTIALLTKILSTFGASFSILHDSDRPKITTKKGVVRNNGAWTNNVKILDAVKNAPKPESIKLCVSVPNFEEACLDYEADDEKPFSAVVRIKDDAASRANVSNLLDFLLGLAGAALPGNVVEWTKIEDLSKELERFEGAQAKA